MAVTARHHHHANNLPRHHHHHANNPPPSSCKTTHRHHHANNPPPPSCKQPTATIMQNNPLPPSCKQPTTLNNPPPPSCKQPDLPLLPPSHEQPTTLNNPLHHHPSGDKQFPTIKTATTTMETALHEHRALSYLDEQWLNNHKEKFVSAWADQSLNFDQIVQSQVTEINASFGRSTTYRYHQHNLSIFTLLWSHVSKEALDLILKELLRLDDPEFDYSMCGCRLRNSCGLPCRALFSFVAGEYIPLDSIDVFWRTLNVPWSEPVENEDIQCDDVLHLSKKSSMSSQTLFFDIDPNMQPARHSSVSNFQTGRTSNLIPDLNEEPPRHGSFVSQTSMWRDSSIDEQIEIERLRKQILKVVHPYVSVSGLVIASTYNKVVINLSDVGGCNTSFPLWSRPPQTESHETIVVAHVDGNHYISVALGEGFPLLLTHPLWITYRSDVASGWEDKFLIYLHFPNNEIEIRDSRFGFRKFINVFSVERLVSNLCTLWMGKFRLHANATKFSRPPVNSVGVTGKSVINGTKAPHDVESIFTSSSWQLHSIQYYL
ncbi:hypothetical protein Tco_0470802 [Tanacetum coccineum]